MASVAAHRDGARPLRPGRAAGTARAGSVRLNWSRVSQFSTPEESGGFLLWQVTHLWQRYMGAGLAKLGLTPMQFILLASIGWLTRDGDVVAQVHLAEFCKVDPMLVSQVIRLLEEKGLVGRRPHPTDTRAKCLSLTRHGVRLLERALPCVQTADRRFFGSVDRARLLSLLRHLFRLHGPMSEAVKAANRR